LRPRAPSSIDAFLAGAERRAWLHARLAVRNDDAALDIVQDAMIKLVEHYADRPAEEWPMLFQRILQNTILDHFRRKKVRDTWTVLVSTLLPGSRDEEEADASDALLERLAGEGGHAPSAEDEVARREELAQIADALAMLPPRQRQAFLLRYWEGYDLAETAAAMGCSEGSVKTHCSRACHALAQALGDKGVARSWTSGLRTGLLEDDGDD
jgi:RNA polymerase sigma-70 factor (ECF subfamily)